MFHSILSFPKKSTFGMCKGNFIKKLKTKIHGYYTYVVVPRLFNYHMSSYQGVKMEAIEIVPIQYL